MMNFQEVYNQHEPRVRQFIRALVRDDWAADDLVQETFISVQKNLGRLRDPSRLSAWVYRIAYNRCRDHFRRAGQAARQERPLERNRELLAEPLFLKTYDQHQMGACVRDKVNLLPEKYRSAVILFDLMDFSQREIAEILDISIDNVKVRLHRGRKQLKGILQNACRLEKDERDVLMCEPIDNGCRQ
jgi:RNA polymerase sigma-70 factor (ECF subfamily)